MKSKGPKFEPCGTPDNAKYGSDTNPFTVTTCFLPDKNDLKKLTKVCANPIFNIFSNSNTWSTLSNALDVSVYKTSI